MKNQLTTASNPVPSVWITRLRPARNLARQAKINIAAPDGGTATVIARLTPTGLLIKLTTNADTGPVSVSVNGHLVVPPAAA